MSAFERKYYGKYRGLVDDSVDSDQKGRISVRVPDVLGKEAVTWATPCLPITGMQSGVYVMPPKDANVWIEFEHGEVDKPIWSGCYWGDTKQIPTAALAGDPKKPPILLQSVGNNSIMIGGDPATGITISCGAADSQSSPKITLTSTAITLSVGNCNIKIDSGSVSINGEALKVSVG